MWRKPKAVAGGKLLFTDLTDDDLLGYDSTGGVAGGREGRLRWELVCCRIADRLFPPFSGAHAAQAGGRWNPRGRPTIYASSSYSGAMLEKLAQLGITRIPRYQVFIAIMIPAGLSVQAYQAGRTSPGMECVRLRGQPGCRRNVCPAVGEAWLAARKTVALIVPSVLFPVEHNVVVNPSHPQAHRIVVGKPQEIRWDQRLFAARPHRSR